MTDFRTRKKSTKERTCIYRIRLNTGAIIVGTGQTPEEAAKNAEDNAAFFGKNRQF